MIWLTAKENTLTRTEPCTMENGSMISSMARGKSAGQMARYMKGSISTAKKMGMVNSIGLIPPALRVTSKIIIFMELGLISGRMGGSSVEIGI